MALNEELGKRIYELRKEKNLSQEELAKMLLINRNKYSEIESGKNDISLSIIEKIMSIYSVDLSYLFNIDKTSIHIASGNAEKFINQGNNNTLHLNIPIEIVEEIKKVFSK
ncbi:MAG: helix-turn-helix domain-containing protein [Chitinophagales bacterium]